MGYFIATQDPAKRRKLYFEPRADADARPFTDREGSWYGWTRVTNDDGDRFDDDGEVVLSAADRKLTDPCTCTCVYACGADPATACSLSGEWHTHADDGRGLFGPCPEHPDAPGDH